MLRILLCALLVTASAYADRPADYVERINGQKVIRDTAKASPEQDVPWLLTTEDKVVLELEMVGIPGGVFTMGSPLQETGRAEDEGPQFEVEVEPLWMSKYEITWDLFMQYMMQWHVAMRNMPPDVDQRRRQAQQADAVSFPTPVWFTFAATANQFDTGPRHPATGMRQLAARQFTKWLSMKTGHFYRLPTEAEWEYACRAGSSSAWCFEGDASGLKEYAWWYDHGSTQEGDPRLHPVGQLRPNAWGLCDMHGNAQEWVIDQYDPKWYQRFTGRQMHAADVINWPTKEFPRVTRGGSGYSYADEIRSAARNHSTPEWMEIDPSVPQSMWWLASISDGDMMTGFRVVRPVIEPSDEQKRRFWEADAEWMAKIIREQSDYNSEVRVPVLRDDEDGEPIDESTN